MIPSPFPTTPGPTHLPIPELDDRDWPDLVEEARRLLPGFVPAWTDFNPSDPGVTLIELFAWVTEMLLYRLDQVPEAHFRAFLALLDGPGRPPGGELEDDLRATRAALAERRRAVTSDDWELLARRASPEVVRAHCVPRRDLEGVTEADRDRPAPGHVSVIVLARGGPPSDELRREVWEYLEPRRLLTARHHVVAPVFAAVDAEIRFAAFAGEDADALASRVRAAVERFFDPIAGGPDGTGGAFGRGVYLSELYELVEGVDGVDHVPEVRLSSRCPAGEARCVEARALVHDDGEPIGLELLSHHLPRLHDLEVLPEPAQGARR